MRYCQTSKSLAKSKLALLPSQITMQVLLEALWGLCPLTLSKVRHSGRIINYLTRYVSGQFRLMSQLISAARQYEDFLAALNSRVKFLAKKLAG